MDTARENAPEESQKPAAMATHFVEAPSSRLPLIVEPPSAAERPLSSLLAWIADKSAMIEGNLAKYGAVLFRGFDVRTALDFERVALAIASRDPRSRPRDPHHLADNERNGRDVNEQLVGNDGIRTFRLERHVTRVRAPEISATAAHACRPFFGIANKCQRGVNSDPCP